MSTFAVIYLRPDGWWIAGQGFDSREECEKCAREQLPENVSWQVVGESTDLFEIAKRPKKAKKGKKSRQ